MTMRTDGLTIVEGIAGTWFYHLRIAGQHDALCGEHDVMPTQLPVSSWGVVTPHLGERYCKACEAKASELAPPQRIQLSRRHGFNLQEFSLALNGLPAVKVDRTTKWGNPFPVQPGYDLSADPDGILARYERHVRSSAELMAALPEIRGKNTACWCRPGPCHAAVLLKIANEETLP